MANYSNRRFIPQPYAGKKSRLTCPGCDEPHCFTRFLDRDTGELLPEEYGLCDHLVSCGYKLSPYARPPGGGMSYATTIERGERPLTRTAPMRTVHLNTHPLMSIPQQVYEASLGHYEHNALAKLLQQHFGLGVALELLQRFHLGTSVYWPGACVFWLVDEHSRVRGGQVVLYDESGHTVKHPRRHTTWVHTALEAVAKRRGQVAPAWLAEYKTHGQKSPCLFGLPQLLNAPSNQPIALVESAKTAMLTTPYMPNYLWLATMGLSYLTPDRLAPLRGRTIVLFPDAGAFDHWQTKAVELRQLGFDVQVSEELEKLATEEERRAGLDLADVLLQEYAGYPPSWDTADNPNITSLTT